MNKEQLGRALDAFDLSETRMAEILDRMEIIQNLLESPTEEASGNVRNHMNNVVKKLMHLENEIRTVQTVITNSKQSLEKLVEL